jgi:hypothetical protein
VDLASVINDHGAAKINSSRSSEPVDQNTTRGGQEEMIRPGKEYKSLISEAASHGCPIHRGVRTYRLLMGAR